jgi:protein SCO1
MARLLARYHRAGAGWHFLTGEEAALRRVADSVGFRYRYDPEADQYAHPAGVVLATGDGKIARYLFGVDLRPIDLRLGIADTAGGQNRL